jgi:hypothetical protein
MTRYTVEASYHTGAHGTFTMPEGKTWGDVDDWYLKWDVMHIQFKGSEEYVEFELNSDCTDGSDWKRPGNATVYARGADGEVDYDLIVAET